MYIYAYTVPLYRQTNRHGSIADVHSKRSYKGRVIDARTAYVITSDAGSSSLWMLLSLLSAVPLHYRSYATTAMTEIKVWRQQ